MKKVFIVIGVFFFIGLCVLLAGCKKEVRQVINVNNMPGKTVDKIKEKTTEAPKERTVTKLSNGSYIIKENTTINQTGVKFTDNIVSDIQIDDVKFADDNFLIK